MKCQQYLTADYADLKANNVIAKGAKGAKAQRKAKKGKSDLTADYTDSADFHGLRSLLLPFLLLLFFASLLPLRPLR